MADDKSGADKYTGNSNRDKKAEDIPKLKVEKVIEGEAVQRKKPLGRRIADNFKGADAQSVGSYVLFEVILPQLKDLVYDVGAQALQRALFGNNGGGGGYRPSLGRKAGYTPYNAIASSAIAKVNPTTKQVTAASDEFGEIIVGDRGSAQEVMDKIGNLIDTYGVASVSDLKAAVGLTGSFVDEKWGWVAMGGTDIRRAGGGQPGYILIFPRPEELK